MMAKRITVCLLLFLPCCLSFALLATNTFRTTNTGRAAVSDHLSESELRQLVKVLEVTHQQAVEAALALVVQGKEESEGVDNNAIVDIWSHPKGHLAVTDAVLEEEEIQEILPNALKEENTVQQATNSDYWNDEKDEKESKRDALVASLVLNELTVKRLRELIREDMQPEPGLLSKLKRKQDLIEYVIAQDAKRPSYNSYVIDLMDEIDYLSVLLREYPIATEENAVILNEELREQAMYISTAYTVKPDDPFPPTEEEEREWDEDLDRIGQALEARKIDGFPGSPPP